MSVELEMTRKSLEQNNLQAPEREKHLTKAELNRLFKSISDVRDRAIFIVAYFRGLRASEVGLLPVTAWDPKTGRLTFRRLKRSDGGKPQVSPLERAALQKWLK